MCNLFFLQMHRDNKLFFCIIKMETHYIFMQSRICYFFKYLLPLSLKYSKSKRTSDCGCPGLTGVKLAVHEAMSVLSVT